MSVVTLFAVVSDSRSGHAGGAAPPVAGSVVRAVPAPPVPVAKSAGRPTGGAVFREAVERAVAPVIEDADGHVAVAVLDPGSGQEALAGDEHTFVTASVAKVGILAAVLLRAHERKRELTAHERHLATSMIRVSDNGAADALWTAIGGAEGMAEANERLGLDGSVPGSDRHWGLTTTTAADQLKLLKAVFTERSPLEAGSRAYLRELMGGVTGDQAWGVSVAGVPCALKNGWLPRTATGLWVVNSIGCAGADGLLIAVLSDGQPDRTSGIAVVERAAAAAAGAARGAAGTR